MFQRTIAYCIAISAIVAIVAISAVPPQRDDDDARTFGSTFTIPGNLAVGGSATVTGSVAAASSSVTGGISAGSATISGTVDSTGIVTARAGVRLTTPTTGPLVLSGSAVPTISATIGSLYVRTGTAQLYQNTDGGTTWTQVGGSASSAGSVTLSVSTANQTNFNLSTEGTKDWVAYGVGVFSNANGGWPYGAITNANVYRKITGGRLAEGFRWVFATSGTASTNATSTAVNADATKFPGRSTTGSDSIGTGTALSSDQTCGSLTGLAGSGFGAIWRIPLRGGDTGTVKIYGLVQDHTETYTAYVESNTAGVQTGSTAGAAGNPGTPVTLTIAYTAATGGDVLVIRWAGSSVGGFNPRLYICSATMF